jgi:hypothetical protein
MLAATVGPAGCLPFSSSGQARRPNSRHKSVKPRSQRLRRDRFLVRLCSLIALSLPLSLSGVSAAHADSIDQAKAQAHRISVSISKLQPQVDVALAAYDGALNAVGQAVTTGVAAQRVYTSLQARAESLAAQRDGHIAALYESGGTVALYVGAVTSGRAADLHELPYLRGVVTSDASRAASASRVAAAAKATADATQLAVDSGLAGADVVNQRLQQLQAVLGQQQALLDQASAHAKTLQAVKDAAAALAASRAAAAQDGAEAAQAADAYPIPPLYRALYHNASTTCPGLSWTVLAAIGQVETHHGSGTMVSSAGALGPMQFLPATFVQYARDGDRDGKANIVDPADAIYSAAAYLCANGAGHGGPALYTALWNYNHADWYVQLVLALSAKIS